jgi:hypothetical protein
MGNRSLANALVLACMLGTVVPAAAIGQGGPADRNVALAYEGFSTNPDGSFKLWFGYFNRNWDREFDVPIGPDNNMGPAGPDRGQPTHFFPRRNQFVFSVDVPADFGSGEVVWTVTTDGITERAYGTLHPLYAVDDVVMSANFGAGGRSGFNPALVGNLAPEVRLESERSLRARVGEPVTLSVIATDDGRPPARPISYRPGQSHEVPNSATGLRFSWYHYRGPGAVTFDPPQTKVWEDRRDGGQSPWSAGWRVPPIPPENRWTAQATFAEPGTYVVRGLAHDGGLLDHVDVTVVVTP